MNIQYTSFQLLFYLFFYAFFAWVIEVVFYAVKDRRFINRGYLNLPLNLPCGLTAVVLILVLPTLGHNLPLQYAFSWVVFKIVRRFSEQFVGNRRHGINYREASNFSEVVEQLMSLTIAGAFLLMYLVFHPFALSLILIMPTWLVQLIALSLAVMTVADYVTVRYATGSGSAARRQADTQRLADRITRSVWNRLQKAYPGVEETDEPMKHYTFARGICLDKLMWVFLVSSFLGALIEMCFCRVTGGVWMNRSSLLYGPFSVVWGLGAVVLTVVLQRFADKADRYVFLAGFVVGGAYEYLCSVFTEIVFGTVFWDYSHMPLNIGGRTNVLYCIFWGILAVVWIKMIYPPMSRLIEKIPPLTGKIVTWALVLVMACNALLTAGAMARCTQRKDRPEAANAVERFLDERYDDAYMARRWPNMTFTAQDAADAAADAEAAE